MGPELSVVIPLLDEAPNVEALYRELAETLEPWGRSFEVVLVDDGSTDGTFDILSRLHAADPRLRVIRLRRNFGQTAAFSAGFARVRGRLIDDRRRGSAERPAGHPPYGRQARRGE